MACRPKTIFESSTVTIQHCPDCKHIFLNMGAVTLNMPESQFKHFMHDMSNANFEYHAYKEGFQAVSAVLM